MTIGSETAYRGQTQRWLSLSLMAFGVACLLFYAFSRSGRRSFSVKRRRSSNDR
jgi:hypothetical protein